MKNFFRTITNSHSDRLIRFNYSENEVILESDSLVEKSKREIQRILENGASEENQTFQNVLEPISHCQSLFLTKSNNISILKDIHNDPNVRRASSESQKKLDEFKLELLMDEKLFKTVDYIKKNEYSNLSEHRQRLVDYHYDNFKRNGMDKAFKEKEKIKKLKKRVNELEIEFSCNINQDETELYFRKNELLGCSEEFLSSLDTHEKDDKKFIINLKYPHRMEILRHCSVESTRQIVYETYERLLIDENPILYEEAVFLRNSFSELLGYEDFTDYQLGFRKMAQNSKTVHSFHENLIPKLQEMGKKDLKVLSELKNIEENDSSSVFYPYDLFYYHEKRKEKEFCLNDLEVKSYFPTFHVLETILKLYEDLFHLRFERIEAKDLENDLQKQKEMFWLSGEEEDSVLYYKVFDQEKETFLGSFYLDLFPRKGKYGWFCVRTIQLASSSLHPIGIMICNFPKSNHNEGSSFLLFSEVQTFLHEFGHLIHQVLNQSPYCEFEWLNVEWDFLECISQMMENFLYQESILMKLMKKKGDGKKDEEKRLKIIQNLIKSRNIDQSLFMLRQIALGEFDIRSYQVEQNERRKREKEGKEKNDDGSLYFSSQELYNRTMGEISLFQPNPETNGLNKFLHLMMPEYEYKSGYYSYLWSKVYSCDLYSRFKSVFDQEMESREEEELNKIGLEFRQKVLEKGSSQNSLEMMVDFLGRNPSNDSFLNMTFDEN